MRQNLFPTLACAACLFAVSSAPTPSFAAKFETLYSFTGNYFTGGPDGANPQGHLVVRGKTIYGATSYGGNGGLSSGTLFEFDTTTGTEAPIFAFDSSPDGYNPLGVTYYPDYLVYATAGGLNESGGGYAPAAAVIGQFNLLTGVNSTLSTFNNGGPAGGIPYKGLIYGALNSGGKYGCGGLFSVNPKTGKQTDLYDFPADTTQGCDPQYGLVNVNGVLYGASGLYSGANGEGVIFSYKIATKAFSVLYSFPRDIYGNATNGSSPGQLFYADGLLYGATPYGGQGSYPGNGTLFSFNPTTNKFSLLYSFTGEKDGAGPSLNAYDNGVLLGQSVNLSSYNTQLIAFNIAKGTVSILHTFTGPDGYGATTDFVKVGDYFYGACTSGGANNAGTIFRFAR